MRDRYHERNRWVEDGDGSIVRPLKLKLWPSPVEGVTANAPGLIEEFLDQLDGNKQVDILKRLLNGESLVAAFGESEGRELAAYRLAMLLPAIGSAATELADIKVFDVVVPDEDTTTADELRKLV